MQYSKSVFVALCVCVCTQVIRPAFLPVATNLGKDKENGLKLKMPFLMAMGTYTRNYCSEHKFLYFHLTYDVNLKWFSRVVITMGVNPY